MAKKAKYVIVRCTQAGVHCGELVRETNAHIVLRKSRRIWYWNGAASLSELAVYGLNPEATGSKISVENPGEVKLRQDDACEIIECQPDGEKCLRGYSPWRA